MPSHEAKLLFSYTDSVMQQVNRISQICENLNDGLSLSLKIGVVPALSFYGGEFPGMRTIKVGTGRFVLAHRRNNTEVKDNADTSLVTRDDFISIPASGPLGQILEQAKEKANLKASPLMATETYHTAISMVREGMGIAVVDAFSARANSSDDVELSEVQGLPNFDVSASFVPNSNKSYVLRAFERTLKTTASLLA